MQKTSCTVKTKLPIDSFETSNSKSPQCTPHNVQKWHSPVRAHSRPIALLYDSPTTLIARGRIHRSPRRSRENEALHRGPGLPTLRLPLGAQMLPRSGLLVSPRRPDRGVSLARWARLARARSLSRRAAL